jgi:hypothetical protein
VVVKAHDALLGLHPGAGPGLRQGPHPE